jgi:hypothetical protein
LLAQAEAAPNTDNSTSDAPKVAPPGGLKGESMEAIRVAMEQAQAALEQQQALMAGKQHEMEKVQAQMKAVQAELEKLNDKKSGLQKVQAAADALHQQVLGMGLDTQLAEIAKVLKSLEERTAAIDKSFDDDTIQNVQTQPYVIVRSDVLYIRVWNQPNLSGVYDVSPDGTISMPLVKVLNAAGLTPGQLEDLITAQLKPFLNDPAVYVGVMRADGRR